MKRALMYATVASMIDLFNMDNIKTLQNLGYQVDVAANFEEGNVTSKERISEFKEELNKINVNYYHLPIPRSISNLKDLKKSYNMTITLRDKRNYDLVHCHTPIGSAICRYAFKNSGSRVIYTAHGFHFYKGAPLKNWLIYYPVEKILSKYTDTLVTINQEDYNNSKKLYSKNNIYIPGIGIDLKKYSSLNSNKSIIFKKEIGLNENDILLFSTGELNDNKNHEIVLRAIAKLNNKSVHYIIAGKGPLKSYLIELSQELKIEKQLHLLGYRKDIPDLLEAIDVFVFPSMREGLSVSLMEAMASSLPVIVSKIRGNNDLVDDNQGGFLFNPKDSIQLTKHITTLIHDSKLQKKFGEYNKRKIENYSSEKVSKKIESIYNS